MRFGNLGKKPELALIGSFVLWGLNRGYGANVGNVRYFLYDYLGLGWIFFFIVGIYLNSVRCTMNMRTLRAIGIVGVCMFVLQLMVEMSGLMSVNALSYLISKLVVLPLMLSVWLAIPVKRLPTCIVSCAFPIYIVHWFLGRIVNCLTPQGCDAADGLIERIVLLFTISLMTSIAIKKFFPNIAKVVFGGR